MDLTTTFLCLGADHPGPLSPQARSYVIIDIDRVDSVRPRGLVCTDHPLQDPVLLLKLSSGACTILEASCIIACAP